MTPARLERGPADDSYTVYVVDYARRAGHRGEHLLGWDERSAEPHDTAYYAWLALSADRTVLIDCGIRADAPLPVTGWQFIEPVGDLIAGAGMDVGVIDTVVLTHLHYDHAGGLCTFSDADVVIQGTEVEYWTGPDARRNAREAWLIEPDALDHLSERRARGTVRVLDGDHEVAPGLSVHLVGGHTAGLQLVRVNTAQFPVVIASDACHFYENLETDRPAPIVHHLPAVFSAFDRIRELAGGGIVLPGHDPAVVERHRRDPGPASPGLIRVA